MDFRWWITYLLKRRHIFDMRPPKVPALGENASSINKKVLCVCRSNISRSPMMPPILVPLLGEGYTVESAGWRRDMEQGMLAYRVAVECMRERGIDIQIHRSRYIDHINLEEYAYIVCVDSEAKQCLEEEIAWQKVSSNPVIIIANEKAGGIADPFPRGIESYRLCAGLLDHSLAEVAQIIKGHA